MGECWETNGDLIGRVLPAQNPPKPPFFTKIWERHLIVSERFDLETWFFFCWNRDSLGILWHKYGRPGVKEGGATRGQIVTKPVFCTEIRFRRFWTLFSKTYFFVNDLRWPLGVTAGHCETFTHTDVKNEKESEFFGVGAKKPRITMEKLGALWDFPRAYVKNDVESEFYGLGAKKPWISEGLWGASEASAFRWRMS
jgi:hypothetical protein